MLTSDFDFELPQELIPDRPQRGASRLMMVKGAESASGEPATHHAFSDLPDLLTRGDLLVLNDTKVLHARLLGRRLLAGDQGSELGGKIEALMIEPLPSPEREAQTCRWAAMLRPAKRQRPGQLLSLAGLDATVIERRGDLFELEFAAGEPKVLAAVEAHGELPLPPYLGRTADERDEVDYQTVLAKDPGAVAAPTAGLHFDRQLLDQLQARGINHTTITLHVGPGTFRPVKTDNALEHEMDAERFVIGTDAARAIRHTQRNGSRVIAVGTTVTRTLEGAFQAQALRNPSQSNASQAELEPQQGRTDLFITPGHRFGVVDGLITNFHLPRSTLLMLVSAFVGRERMLDAYRAAVEKRYRFYSYGDAMLLWP